MLAITEQDAINSSHRQEVWGFATLAERLRRSTVQVKGSRYGGGSGVVWRADGLVITNSHVVRGAHARVQLSDGRVFDAEVISRSRGRDLAALKVDAGDLPACVVGDSDSLRAGELVLAVGNPLGHNGALATGIIHAAGRRWVRADVRLAPGNSGGPLANARGEVIGINSMIARGLALAVPGNEVERFLRRGAEGQYALGVTVRPIPIPLAEGRTTLGLMVLEVGVGSSAEGAGLVIGDVIIGAGDDHHLRTPDELRTALSTAGGDSVALDLNLIRGGKRMRLTVTVRKRRDTAES